MSIKQILNNFKDGFISIKDAEKELRLISLSKISNWGNIDLQRECRAGAPEVVYGEGKTEDELVQLVISLLKEKGRCIITRLSDDKQNFLANRFRNKLVHKNSKAALLVIKDKKYQNHNTGGKIAVFSAGTLDIPSAEEAVTIAKEMGCQVYSFYDIGVAGIHRLIPAIESSVNEDVDVIIVAAGMEGALPSVVAGLVDIPVVGLPTSTGYGIGGEGKAALYSMLQSCAPGLAAVNIDNGLGAGMIAAIIANRVAKFR
jgi:hypothetical protein|tara:strand:- start:4040 stop:4813 length:774 start_codon:yes stop_codon:yes gene_type:complete